MPNRRPGLEPAGAPSRYWPGRQGQPALLALALALGAQLVAAPAADAGSCANPAFQIAETPGAISGAPSPPVCFSGNTSEPECICNDGFNTHCVKPREKGRTYRLANPLCDPETAPLGCAVEIGVTFEFPENEENISQSSGNGPTPQILWFNGPTSPSCNPAFPGCGAVTTCGSFGTQEIAADTAETFTTVSGVTCANVASTQNYSVNAYTCVLFTPSSCRRETRSQDLVGGGQAMAVAIGCDLPPTSSPCSQSCTTQTGSGGTASVGGGGAGLCDANTGPGARLRHLAGGVGHPGLPGTTAAWTTELGRYWSHDYAERIVVDLDESHVWLMTKFATFREFSDLEAPGPMLRAYGTNSPSDEYRTLYFDTTTSGWELHDLDGTVMTFDSAGRWTQTVDRNGNATVASYGGSDLTSVTFPDGRSEDFTYHPSGKLATITEVGVGSAASLVWSYTWNGDDLGRVDRPDGTAFEFFYDNPALPGYLTRVELEGTDGTSQRVMNAWEYDAEGNVIKTWKGDTTTDATGAHPGPGAVDLWSLSLTNPKLPTKATVTDPLLDETEYQIARDEGSLKPKVTMISGDCPICGLGPTSELNYTDANNPLLPTETIDAKGTSTTFAYNSNGRATSRTEAVGVAGLERTTTWDYDTDFPAFPTLIQQPSTSGTGFRETTMVYDPTTGDLDPRTIEGTEAGAAFGLATDMIYNTAGQPLTIDPPGFGTADQTGFSYDSARGSLLPLTRTDPLLGTPTSFAYDAFNRRTAVTDPNGVTTETQYDDLDRVRKVIQRAGTLGVDFSLGDPPQAGDLVTESVYNVFGDLFRTILPELNVIEYGYDAAGRLVSIARKPDAGSPAAECTRFGLDKAGNRILEELLAGDCVTGTPKSTTGFHYKNRIQLERIDHADGTSTEYAYDANGNLEKVWDAKHPSAGQTVTPTQTYEYDALDRLIALRQPWSGAVRPVCQAGDAAAEAVTRYGYDVQDHLISVADAECNTTTYEYSDRDLLTEQVSPVSGTTTFVHNEHGELTDETDARGVLTLRTPDELDRVTKVEYLTGGTTVVPALTTDYTYDDPAVAFSKGRLTAITRNAASVDYQYDRFGRVLQDGALGYTYDANGNRATIAYPSGVTATYTHDFADREKTLTVGAQSVVTDATYRPSGPLATLDLGNGAVETRGFTTRYFPETIDLAGDRQRTWTYTTDDVGNVEQIAETTDCQATVAVDGETLSGPELKEACLDVTSTDTTIDGPGAVTFRAGRSIQLSDFTVNAGATFIAENDARLAGITFDYDYLEPQYFLTQGDGPWGELDWTYDRIGNRLSQVRTLQSEAGPVTITDTYTYLPNAVPMANTPILDEIMSSVGGTRNYTYGLAGHLEEVAAGVNVIGFTSDAAGRLAGLQRAVAMEEASFTYDGRSFLQQAERPLGGSDQATTDPTYSSEGLLHCLRRQEDDLATPKTIDYFYFAGRPVAQRMDDQSAVTWTFFTTDHLGTPAIATDIDGEEVWLGPFEPFGTDYGTDAAAQNLFLRLPGQWDDGRWANASLGADLYYNVHRWYDHQTGRYGRVDPLGLETSANLFTYALNRPTGLIDPDGRQFTEPGSFGPTLQCVLIVRDVVRAVAKHRTRYQHCLGNCLITKICPGGAGTAVASSLAKEASDLGKCLLQGKQGNCDSFWQREDFDDNRLGRECPPEVPCSERCNPLWNAPEPPPGPFGFLGNL